MSDAVLLPPQHPGKELKRLAEMSEHDHHYARSAEEL
jgi:hypothetical protein